jgi:hypothetical protein
MSFINTILRQEEGSRRVRYGNEGSEKRKKIGASESLSE